MAPKLEIILISTVKGVISMKRILLIALPVTAAVIISIFLLMLPGIDDYTTSGKLPLQGLEGEVRVVRDEKGMAYLYASSREDALRAQGFLTAQDRLFQMELSRLMSQGRISELAGEQARELDIRMRTLGFYRAAKKHASILSPESTKFFQSYVDGVNEFIHNYPEDHQRAFSLAGLEVRPWTVEDSLAIMYYMGWITSANVHSEIIGQMIIDAVGEKLYREISPVNINPDDEGEPSIVAVRHDRRPVGIQDLQQHPLLAGIMEDGVRSRGLGSNNWAVNGTRTGMGMPIVANDPHLETTLMPGPMYPIGIFTEDVRMVGAVVPGIPGIIVGRNNNIAMGITNAYGDCQDLYLETIDPSNPGSYMEKGKPVPFQVIRETILIRDSRSVTGMREETISIRKTKRGPVVSTVLPGLKSDHVLSLRWAPYEAMKEETGIERIMDVSSVSELRDVLSRVTPIALNFVMADTDGNIAWQTTGQLPIRRGRDGSLPAPVPDRDDWIGWIPKDEMPHRVNPDKGWVGTSNHKAIKRDYPYYYSSYFSSSFRYRRLKELMSEHPEQDWKKSWKFQRDNRNKLAEEMAPVFAEILMKREDTRDLGDILLRWDNHDRARETAPALFQMLLRRLVYLTFRDKLGEELTGTMLDVDYYWKERFLRMFQDPDNQWFDDRSTARRENRDDLILQAVDHVKKETGERTGKKATMVEWGDIHTMYYMHPIGRSGILKTLLGKGPVEMSGSNETLYRALYRYSDPYKVRYSAALRMVADLSDPDRVAAVLSCGVTDRLFHPHASDQIRAYHSGTPVFWWFSDTAVSRHGKVIYHLVPAPDGSGDDS